ncbi:MAG: DUF2214 family protein [Marinoscillum sp.]
MNTFVLVKYIHLIGIFGLVGTLVAELILTKPVMKRHEISLLARVDAVYGLSTMIVLAAGFVLWFGVGKPAEFYSTNWIFISKLVVFGIIGGLSIWPTVFFLKNRKGDQQDEVFIPGGLRIMVRCEIGLLIILPLLAVLMVNGIGHF